MVYLLALSSAILYGAADFIGGLASRRAHATVVVVLSQFAGLVLLILAIPVLPAARPFHADLLWGALAGVTGGTGVALLYRALAIGTMGVVAPTTAVSAVVIPVAAGLIFGERLTPQASAGIVLAIVAIALVSQQPSTSGVGPSSSHERSRLPDGFVLAVLSGVAIGGFFLALARTNPAAGMWPLVAARTMSVGFFILVAVIRGDSLRLLPPVRTMSIAGGVLDMLANVLYLLASRRGALALVVTLASLYPASTVVLARIVLGERLSRVQQVGIVCALVAVALIVYAPS